MSSLYVGLLVPIPILPAVSIAIAVVAPLLPTLNKMLSLDPTPEVDCNVSDWLTLVPPVILVIPVSAWLALEVCNVVVPA